MNSLEKRLIKGCKKETTGHLGYVQEFWRTPDKIVFKGYPLLFEETLLKEAWYLITLWIRTKLKLI